MEEALAELSQPPSGEDVTAPVPMDGQAIAISLLQKTFHDGTYQDQIQFEFRFTNNLEKTVRAFTGVVVFQDLFDRDIMRVNVTVEDPVNPSGTVTWSGGIDYNQFIDTHQRLRSIAQRDLQTKFELTSVIFADGTRRRFDN